MNHHHSWHQRTAGARLMTDAELRILHTECNGHEARPLGLLSVAIAIVAVLAFSVIVWGAV